MTLKLNLAPGESLLIGRARVQNGGDKRCSLIITGNENILHQRHIMLEQDANTSVKRFYFVVQGIYLADDKDILNDLYHKMSREAVAAWPVLTLAITDISEMLLGGRYYEALAAAHKLIAVEAELMSTLVKDAEECLRVDTKGFNEKQFPAEP